MHFKPRFMCSVPNPSQALVVDASHGCYSELPIACEVQWWHQGEDGAIPRVVDLRGPIDCDIDFQFDEMQEWFVDEFLDHIYLQSEPEDDEPLPAPRAWAYPEANPWPFLPSKESEMSKLTEAAHNALSVLRAMTRTYPYDGSIWSAIDELKFALLSEAIETHAEDGKVAVVESGRDCDCVEYHGRVHTIDATLEAYLKLYEDTMEWADGPFHFEITSLTEAKRIRYSSRDLVMEAYEDGHPHSIHSEFP